MKLTLSVRSFQVPATPGTCAWPPSLPSVPTSRATRVTSEANALSWSTMVLMVSFSSRISPRTSTVILRDRSPRATAVVTCAMLRTWSVRLPHMAFTESVRSFQVPATPGTIAWPPSLPSVPTSRATRVTSEANERSWSTIVLMASLSCRISPRTSTVIFFDRSPLATAMVTSAMLRTWAVRFDAIEFTLSVRSFHTPVTSRTCAWPPSLPSVPTSRATRVTSEVNTLSCLIMVLTMLADLQELALQRAAVDVEPHGLQQVALRDRGDGARHFGRRPQEVVDQGVDRALHLAPGAAGEPDAHALAGLAFAADHLADPFELAGHALLAATISLKVSAILPMMPTWSPAMRTVKSPTRTACSACISSCSCACEIGSPLPFRSATGGGMGDPFDLASSGRFIDRHDIAPCRCGRYPARPVRAGFDL